MNILKHEQFLLYSLVLQTVKHRLLIITKNILFA